MNAKFLAIAAASALALLGFSQAARADHHGGYHGGGHGNYGHHYSHGGGYYGGPYRGYSNHHYNTPYTGYRPGCSTAYGYGGYGGYGGYYGMPGYYGSGISIQSPTFSFGYWR